MNKCFEVYGWRLVNGEFWRVSLVIEASGDDQAGMMADLDRKISGAKQAGIIPHIPSQEKMPAGTSRQPANNTMERVGPVCPYHGDEMRKSRVQKNKTQIMYYCSKKDDDDYCNYRGAVNKESGEISTWEKK